MRKMFEEISKINPFVTFGLSFDGITYMSLELNSPVLFSGRMTNDIYIDDYSTEEEKERFKKLAIMMEEV